MSMHNPPHPREVVKHMLIDELHLNVTEAAKSLGIGRVTLSRLINKHSGITPEMAIRLSLAIRNTESKMWLNMQSTYDLYIAEKNRKRLTKQVISLDKKTG